jgi:hypothetical protein
MGLAALAQMQQGDAADVPSSERRWIIRAKVVMPRPVQARGQIEAATPIAAPIQIPGGVDGQLAKPRSAGRLWAESDQMRQ